MRNVDENNQNHSNLPAITVEIFSEPPVAESSHSIEEKIKIQEDPAVSPSIPPEIEIRKEEPLEENLSTTIEKTDEDPMPCIAFTNQKSVIVEKAEVNAEPKSKHELLEYLIQSDGSVVCKMCGEVLQSRTHWYRHKYKLHVPNTGQPAPLFQCEQCSAFFKSRKGYIGHLASRHTESDLSEVTVKQEPADIEEPTIKVEEKNLITQNRTKGPETTISREIKSSTITSAQPTSFWDEQREREEKLVAEIIDRVRRECEAQGTTVSRRGYSRRSTVMNT